MGSCSATASGAFKCFSCHVKQPNTHYATKPGTVRGFDTTCKFCRDTRVDSALNRAQSVSPARAKLGNLGRLPWRLV